MADDTSCQQDMPDQADDKPQSDRYSNTAPKEYFTERVPVFKRLCRLRDEVSHNYCLLRDLTQHSHTHT